MLLIALLHLLPWTLALSIVSSNDDGWAEANIRELYDVLTAKGHNVVVSAPAENQSGAGSKDSPPTKRNEPCQYNSCDSHNMPYGAAQGNRHLNWVNSYPVTSMRYGIDKFMPSISDNHQTDLAISGINVDPNVGQSIEVSGTVGAAVFATHERGIPAVAFSGWGNRTGWDEPRPSFSKLYARAAVKLIDCLIAENRPFLPRDTWLNVNFPHYNTTSCSKVSDVKFVLTTIGRYGSPSYRDSAKACGSPQLPTEIDIVLGKGCYASVSVGDAITKKDASPAIRHQVAAKLNGLLSHYHSD